MNEVRCQMRIMKRIQIKDRKSRNIKHLGGMRKGTTINKGSE